jgi:hypothetical protein
MTQKTSPQHYYVVAALLTFIREGKPRQRHMNVVLELHRKAITASVLDNARSAFLQRLADETQVSGTDVNDITFLSFSYLGTMRPEDFYDTQKSTSATPSH